MKMIVTEYQLNDFKIKAREIVDSEVTSWGVYMSSLVYSKKNKQFEWEPLPSSRDNEWLKDHRFNSLEEAKNIIEIVSKKED
jgi:hypothetical protein